MDETNNELWTYTPNNVDVETTIRKIFTSLGIRDNHHNIFDDIKRKNWFYWWFYGNNCDGKMKMERTVRVINCRMKVLYECWNASGFIPFMDVAEANKYLLETNEVGRQVIRFSQTRPGFVTISKLQENDSKKRYVSHHRSCVNQYGDKLMIQEHKNDQWVLLRNLVQQ